MRGLRHGRRWQPAGRHRRLPPPSRLAARYAGVTALLGTVAVSGWFTALGAAAFAQMLR